MQEIRLKAYGKINLTLDVLNKRPDGYHEVKMILQTVSLCDELCVKKEGDGGILAKTNLFYVPTDERNSAVAAAQAFFAATGIQNPGIAIHIKKNIPVAAGLAGGSADAAAVLKGLNRLFDAGLSMDRLLSIGAAVGSDVPFCLTGGTVLAAGRGEELTVLSKAPDFYAVLCKPAFSLSTAKMYGYPGWERLLLRPDTEGMLRAIAAGRAEDVAARVFNVMEQALAPDKRRAINEIKGILSEKGALGTSMSGSGPTVYGLFMNPASAKKAADALESQYKDVFLCRFQPKVD